MELTQREVIERARSDVNFFIEYVFPGLKQWPFHRRIQELANEHQYLNLWAPVEHGKTFQLSMARPLWLIGNNHGHSIAIVSNAIDHPVRCLSVLREQMETNERLQEVFPTMKLKQNTQTEITLERGITTKRDATLVAFGIGGSIVGRRWTGLIMDDILDFDATWTHEQRQKLWKVLESTVFNRVLQNGFIHSISTPWHVEDATHRLAKLKRFTTRRFDGWTGLMHDAQGRVIETFEGGLWPAKYQDPETGDEYGFTRERLVEKREGMTEMEFNRQYRCIASSGTLAIFKPKHIEACKELGRGLALGRESEVDDYIVTGVDLAIKKADSADKTVFLTGCIREGKKEILDIKAGNWELPTIAQVVLDTVRTYKSHYGFCVESNAAQTYMIQALQNRDIMRSLGATDQELERIRIFPHYTGPKKYDPVTGIRGMAVDFEQGRIKLPCDNDLVPEEEISELITGLLAFDPMAHTSDHVMALWLFTEHVRRYWVIGGSSEFADCGVW